MTKEKKYRNWPFWIEQRVTLSRCCVEMHYGTVWGKVFLFLLAVKGLWNRCLVQNNVHYFHINLNTPYLPPKICISTVSKFSWEDCNPKRNWKQCLRKTFGAKQGVFWECESSELESFRFEDEEECEYEIQLKLFVRVLKKDTRQASFYFSFPPKKLVRLSILNEVTSSPDDKIIKLLTFNNLFPPLRHSR